MNHKCFTPEDENPPCPSSVRLGFFKGGCALYAVKQCINSLTHFLLRKDYFPLTLTLSPIGGEGKKWNQLNVLWLLNLSTSSTPSPPASGGEGWGEGGRTTACNFLTGHCCPYPPFSKGGFKVPLSKGGFRGIWVFTAKPAATFYAMRNSV